MELCVPLLWLAVVVPEFANGLSHVEAYVKRNKHAGKKKYRPIYHISSPNGWVSDPTGFAFFKKQYHMFFQFHPYNGYWGHIHWGHAVSINLVDWTHFPPAIVPREYYEMHGCQSGTALVHNDYLTLFYTGTVIADNETFQTQNLALSGDGVVFQKYIYNPIIREAPHGVGEFRNPRVWKFRNTWYMMIGTTSREGNGKLILYTSGDMFNWKLDGTIAESMGDMGSMWENPDMFLMDGQHILIFSVQGIKGEGYRFRNPYQTGYVVGNFDYVLGQFEDLEISTTTFTELDYGHDFYAAKTMLSTDGRRLLVAWLGMWGSEFLESKDGWASMLTIVRELRLSDSSRLIMTPVREMVELRAEILEDAWYGPGEMFIAGTKSFELIVNSSAIVSYVGLIFEWGLDGRLSIGYHADHAHVSLDRGGPDGLRIAEWAPNGYIHWRIFMDGSSVELFCGDGDVVFTSRIYPKKDIRVRVSGDTQLHILQYRLRKSIGHSNKRPMKGRKKTKISNKFKIDVAD
ncbi:PREDICTED: raffinose invertase-like [Papilio xuthus]|uniref:Sucrose-6-phosphate hydrolase n=1 Tax=Papilio xuthus TaxID=66420 RepID=A0A194QGN4_PAPXU|nr:PREDICTED: raffinose invertase-like [Papilio xuthus]KPJ02606.1 Raffinose invertase [Papilio xuthus]